MFDKTTFAVSNLIRIRRNVFCRNFAKNFAYSIKKYKTHLNIFVEIGVRVTCTSTKGSKKRLVKCNNDAAAIAIKTSCLFPNPIIIISTFSVCCRQKLLPTPSGCFMTLILYLAQCAFTLFVLRRREEVSLLV